MKKIFLILFLSQILFSCRTSKAIAISDIDNSFTKFEHYIVVFNSGEKIKTKYVFNRGENIEISSQGQSKFYLKSDIKSISGTNDDNRKGYIVMGSTILAGGVIATILLNNGATSSNEKRDF